MSDREELAALRRMAELEAKVGASTPTSAAPTPAPAPEPSPLTGRRTASVAVNAGNEAVAGIPDMVMNAPTNIWNLGKAAFGTAAGFAGRPDLMPELTPTPDLARRGLKATGFINDQNAPQTPAERRVAAISGGAVGAAVAPARSIPQMLGATLVGGIGGEAANETKEATGNDALAISAGLLTPSAVQRVGDYGRNAVAAAPAARARNAVEDATLAAGRQAGYVTPPTAVVNTGVRGFINRRLESIGGKAAVKQEAGNRNQDVTNELAVQDLGLPRGTAINEAVLENYRTHRAAPYREIAAIDPHAAATLQDLRQTRNDAQAQHRFYERSADPAAQTAARQLDARAQVLENALEAIAINSGRAGLVDDMRAARTAIAKSYDVERGLNLGNADVSAPRLAAREARGTPLTGGLQTASRFSAAFPQFTTEGARIPTPGVSKSEALAALLLGGGGGAAFGPLGAAAGALPLLSGPARSVALSRPYQNLMATRNYDPSMVARGAAALPSASQEQNFMRSLLLGNALRAYQPEE